MQATLRKAIACRSWQVLLFLVPLPLLAHDCESIIELSKVADIIVADKEAVELNAATFCDAYYRRTADDRSAELAASYKVLSGSIRGKDASEEAIAGRYCSGRDRAADSKNAFRRYVETISPKAYEAYDQCVRMAAQDLKFTVNVGSILPTEFSILVSFTSSTGQPAAKVEIAASRDVTCRWRNSGTSEVLELASGSSVILQCERTDPRRESYVTLARSDAGSTSQAMTIPWQEYTAEGQPAGQASLMSARVQSAETSILELSKLVAGIAAQSGTINLRAGSGSRPLTDASSCPASPDNFRGEFNGRVQFDRPFVSPPRVMVGLSSINARGGDPTDATRLSIEVKSIDTTGFTYAFHTWCTTVVFGATALWLAVPAGQVKEQAANAGP